MRLDCVACDAEWEVNACQPIAAIHHELHMENLRNMKRKRLEKIVNELVVPTYSTRSSSTLNIIKPNWWPEYLNFGYPVSIVRGKGSIPLTSWCDVLRDMIRLYGQHHNLKPIYKSPEQVQWQKFRREVLQPKLIDDNVYVKPMSFECDGATLKKLSVGSENVKPRLRRFGDPLGNGTAIVRLYDVLQELSLKNVKEQPINKNDYMSTLGLSQRNCVATTSQSAAKCPSLRQSEFLNIPFSSDLGQSILKRDKRYIFSDHALLKRIERQEWYLGDQKTTVSQKPDYKVTYDYSEDKCTRKFKFARRQFSQQRISLKNSFLQSISKPVTVVLERDNLEAKLEMFKRLAERKRSYEGNCQVVGNEDLKFLREGNSPFLRNCFPGLISEPLRVKVQRENLDAKLKLFKKSDTNVRSMRKIRRKPAWFNICSLYVSSISDVFQ